MQESFINKEVNHMANAANIEAKKLIVQEIEGRLKKAKLVVFADYRSVTVSEISDLRNQLRLPGVTAQIYKNTMLDFALQNCGYSGFGEMLFGPNLVVFSEEELVEPAKILNQFSRTSKKLEIKMGILEGNLIDGAAVKALAELPPRDVLLSQVVGTLQAPITSLVRVLNANITGLVRVLDQVREKQAS
jgi:large subunit ribosomal protein L10